MAIHLKWLRRRHPAELGTPETERPQGGRETERLPGAPAAPIPLHGTPAEPIPLPVPARPATQPSGFRIEGRRVGILLVHGLTSTPLSMQPLGMALARHGMDVEAIV